MAEEIKDTVIEEKTPEQNAEVAPVKDETTEQTSEVLDAEDIDDALVLLNIMDKEVGGTGEIAEIPEAMRNSIKYLVEKLVFVRDLFEDPLWKSILDDMADQKEDGKTPSVEVAIARNIPLEKIQTISESEEYDGVQDELTSSLANKKQMDEEDAALEVSFDESLKGLDEHATEMGYSEDEKNELANFAFEQYKVWADGKLVKDEWNKIDKMRNYDKDTADLRSQVRPKEAKEVLPDKASVEAAVAQKPIETKTKKPVTGPGLSSMGAYENVGTNYTQTGKNRYGK